MRKKVKIDCFKLHRNRFMIVFEKDYLIIQIGKKAFVIW